MSSTIAAGSGQSALELLAAGSWAQAAQVALARGEDAVLIAPRSVAPFIAAVAADVGDSRRSVLIITATSQQADDIMRGYTVARAREDAVFAPGEEKQIACIYLCG